MALPPNLESLIQGLQINDPKLYQVLSGLVSAVEDIQLELHPLVIRARTPTPSLAILSAPTTFTSEFTPVSVRFLWSQIVGAIGYEIRQGSSWDTATFRVRTPSLQADLDPLLYGTYTFLIKTINAAGAYSETPNSVSVTVPVIPAVVIRREVIDNNVLLYWTAPASVFRIQHYVVLKDDNVLGKVDSTFFSIFENVAGTYTYEIYAVDVAGNEGISASIEVEVASPPDYALQDSRVSDLMGTRIDCIRSDAIPSLIIAHADETWDDHYVNNTWGAPQEQVDAGYPIYIQPTTLNSSYEETIDYGLVVTNTIVTITWNLNIIVPGVTIVVWMSVSDDDITYSAWSAGASQFFPSLRYLRFKLEFTLDNDHSVVELYALTISLAVKRENDGGEINALSTDVGGTEVFFTKPFKDIESITATTKSITEPYVVIFDFTDIPNPVSFFVYVFDTTGNRVTKVVDWKARGIV